MDDKHHLETQCINDFEALIQNGDTLRQASRKVGKTLIQLRKAYAEAGREWPNRPNIKNKVRSEIEGLITKGWSQAKIASTYNLKKSTLSNWVYEWDLSDHFIRKGPRSTILNAEAKSRQVLDHIKKLGGTINQAIEALGISITAKTVKKYAQKFGFDLEAYRLAYQKYGEWEIQPGRPLRIYQKDYVVKAKCGSCEESFDVSLVNLKSGKSQSCRKCSPLGIAKKTVCVETGQEFRSIRALATHLDALGQYQSIRQALRTNETYKHEGLTYIIQAQEV